MERKFQAPALAITARIKRFWLQLQYLEVFDFGSRMIWSIFVQVACPKNWNLNFRLKLQLHHLKVFGLTLASVIQSYLSSMLWNYSVGFNFCKW